MPHESNTNPQLTAENSVIYSDIPNEAQQTIYGVTLPDGVTVEANIHTPVDYQGKKYIRIGEHIYQVHHDAGRDVWCIYHGDNPIKPALAVHYEDGGWKLQNTGALPGGIPERPDSTTPRYAELSILTLEQLNKESQKINEEYGKIIRDTRQLVEDIKTEIETQHLKLAIEQVKGGGLNGQLDAAKNVVTAFSALAGVDRSIIDRFEQNYQALEGRKQQLDNANSELVNRWKSYRKWESDTVQQMQTLEPHSIARIQGHIENNNAVDPSKHPASKPGISATGDITGAHMKDSFMQAVTAHGAKIVGYRTYAHAPGVIQVSYLMPGDAGYGDVTPPVNNGLAVPVLPATTAGVAGLPPQAISPLEQIGSGHPAWHIYDSSGPYAPSCAPTTASRSTPRLKTIFDPNTAGSIVTDINQYMGYVRETLATLGNLNLLRADQMRYNVPVPSLTSDAGDIRMVMYFSKEADPKNPSLHHIKPSSAYINVNSPAMASAYTDVVSNGLPVTENAPADLGNQLLKNPLDLHNFVTAIRGTAVTSVKNGTTGESSKWLFQLDAAASSSMKDLFLQNPHHSELMLWNADNTAADTRHRSLKWNGQSLVVNEVPMTATGNSLKLTVVVNPGAGGRDIEALKTNFSKLLNNLKGFGRDTRVDIELVGCSVEHIYSSDSNLIKQLTSELLPLLDVNPGLREKLTFTTRQYAQRTADGGGQEVYVPTRGWIADTGILADNEKYKSTWRYDSKERQMVSEVQPHKLETFKGVVDKLYKGQVTVEQLTPEDKQLVLLFMDDDQIKALSGAESSKNQDGLRLYQVVITLAEQYASATEGIFDGKAAFNAAMAQTDAVKLPGSLSGTVAYGTERWKFNGEARNSEHLQTFEEEVKGKLATPDTPQDTDGNETRWVIQLQGDDVSSNAASALFLKHPANSELILWDREKTTTKKWDPSSKRYVIIENGERHQSLKWAPQSQKLVRSTISPPGGRLKILFVGHGRRTGSGEHGDLIFAERGIELWKTDFSAMLDSIKKGNVTHIDVTLVGCTLIDEHAPQNGLPQQLADLLLARGREFGIAPENLSLSARQHYIRVQPDGRKEAYIDGEWRPTGAGMEDGEYKHVWRYDRDTGKMETRTTQHSPVFYRTDRRSREQIQADGGFKPWDKHFTLEHAREFIKFFIGDKHVTEADIKNNPKYTKNGQNMLMPLIGVKPNLIELSRIIRYTVSGVTPWVCAATNTDTGGRVAGTAGGIYKISIPTTENLRAFEMAGGQLRRLDQDWRTYTKPLLLLNADSIDTATIIAFTHGIGSKAEVTFFTSIPSDNISLFFVESDVANTLGDTQGKAQWKWKHETNLQKLEESIKKKFTLADTRQNAGESQWIIQLQGDATTSDTTGDLFLKHPAHSELILWDTSAAAGEMNNSLKWDSQRQTLVRGPVVAPQGKLNICFVGHGADSNSDAVFGGHSPDVWKSNFSKLLAAIPQGVTHINITFVGYRRVDDTSPESRLPQQLSDMLLARGKALGIAPEHVSLSTQQHDMRIMPDGRKEMYIPGEGWISGENVIAENERHRYVWHHDSATGTMVSEIGLHRLTAFREVVERLWAGQVFFHELLPTEQQLVLRFLEAGEITALSQKSKDGEVLHQAIKELVKRHNPDVGIIDGKAALHAILDAENAAWHKLAQELGISVDTQADTEAGRAVFDGMHQLRQQGGDKGSNGKVPADSYTEKAMGLRFRVMYKLQTFVERAGKGVLALGSVAAICRIKVINDRLASEKLSDEDASKLRTERAFAISELGVDLSDEAVGFLQSKWGIQISRTGAGAATSATVPQSSGLTLGTRMTRGLRAFGPGVASTLLSAAGTALAWYGVSRAIEELQEFKKGELAAIERGEEKQFQDRVTQMRVNLGVNIATAIISTVLTVGSATAFITGLVGAGSLAAMAAASFMAVAGPVGGALLVGAFIGLWIYNGIKTVEEFSRHMKLDAWDKFRLGAGSIFGAIPAELQRDLDVSKLRQAVERARQLEISGTFDRLPEVKTIYHVMPEIIPGTVYTKIWLHPYKLTYNH